MGYLKALFLTFSFIFSSFTFAGSDLAKGIAEPASACSFYDLKACLSKTLGETSLEDVKHYVQSRLFGYTAPVLSFVSLAVAANRGPTIVRPSYAREDVKVASLFRPVHFLAIWGVHGLRGFNDASVAKTGDKNAQVHAQSVVIAESTIYLATALAVVCGGAYASAVFPITMSALLLAPPVDPAFDYARDTLAGYIDMLRGV